MRPFSRKASLAPLTAGSYIAVLAMVLCGCRKEEIRTYTAPKEVVAAPKVSNPHGAMAPSEAPPAPMRWTTPAGWAEQPASGMRVGSFSVAKDGRSADVSIIPLGGISGSELENVNRWRGQVGLKPVDASQLADTAEKISIGATPAALYDLAGTDPQSKEPARILASILAQEGTTWFFKMSGPDALVAEQKPAFVALLKSIEFASPTAAAAAAADDAERPVSTNVKEIPGTAGREGKPVWEIPPGWQEQPASSMRLASFLISSPNGAKADLSVIKLGGIAGGTLPNVNRWRSQLGLEPVDEAGLAKLLTTREVAGTKILVVDMAGKNVETGDPARMLAAIVPRSSSTWFYKLLGDDQLVAEQKAAFLKFVESARYPNAS